MYSLNNSNLSLNTPVDIQREIAADLKRIRLEVFQWKRETLASKSGVPVSTIKRFERTGEISLRQMLWLVHALGYTDRLKGIFHTDVEGMSMGSLLKMEANHQRKRGRK